MTAIDRILTSIRANMERRNWNKPKLAEKAGVNYSTIRDLGKPEWNPTVSTVRKLLEAFQKHRR